MSKDIIEYFTFLTGLTPTEDQRKLLLDLVDSGVKKILISAGRQAGKTLCSAVAILWFVFEYETPVKVLLVSAQENVLYFHLREIFKSHPEFKEQIVHEGVYSLVPLHGFETVRDSIVYVRGSTDKQIRGLPADIVFIDEACEVKDDIILTAIGNLSGKLSKIVCLSTPHIDSSIFVKWVRDPKELGFKLHTWSIRGLSWHDVNLLKVKKREYSPQRFRVEVDGIPLTSEERAYFPPKAITKMFIEGISTEPTSTLGASTQAGLDLGYGEPNVSCLTIVEHNKTKNRILLQRAFKILNSDNLEDMANAISKFKCKRIQVDSRPTELAGLVKKEVQTKLKMVKFHFVDAVISKEVMLSTFKEALRSGRIEACREEFIPLRMELQKYRPKKRSGDNRVDSLILASIDDPNEKGQIHGRVYFPPGFDREGGAAEYNRIRLRG